MLDERRQRIHVAQGDAKVSAGPDVVMTTLLGSCVAACIRDPGAGVGGMNHFLLPGEGETATSSRSESYGLYLMELLINGLLKKGARRGSLEAKLFGGARMFDGLSDIGAKNAAFAKRFLEMEGIPLVGGNLGGTRGRRLEYWPVSGRARQSVMDVPNALEIPVERPAALAADAGELELF